MKNIKVLVLAFIVIWGSILPTGSAQAADITISGSVGTDGAGATLTYYGVDDVRHTATANTSGNYSFSVSTNWSGTVEPSLTGKTFSPSTRSYTDITTNQTGQDYTPRAVVFKDYYVNNTNRACSASGGGTLNVPFCTITQAANVAIAGNTVHVVAGVYAETVRPNFGNPDAPVTIVASPGVTVSGEAGNTTNGGAFRITNKHDIVVDGFRIIDTADYGIYSLHSARLTIRNNQVSGAGDPASAISREGIYFDGTTDSTISGNRVFHNSYHGIQLFNGSSNNLISNNISYGNAVESLRRSAGIDVWNSNYNTIIHNILYANEDSGLSFYTGSHDNTAIGNSSYGNGDHGIDDNASPNNTFVGNMIQGNVTAGINLENNSTDIIVMNNILVNNGYKLQIGGGTTPIGKAGNISVDATSITGTNLDYNLYFLGTAGATQIIWGNTFYTTLTSFQSAQGTQEVHGSQGDPLFSAPAPAAQRPASAPWNIAEHVGDYHLKTGSPAIDSANSNAPGEPALDLDGNGRVDVSTIPNTGEGTRTFDDRGPYEFQTGHYTLTITSVGGTVIKNPDKSTYDYNDVVQLTATPNDRWNFVSWSGDVTGTTNPITIAIHRNTSITANYFYGYKVYLPLIMR